MCAFGRKLYEKKLYKHKKRYALFNRNRFKIILIVHNFCTIK